ncbi:SPBc2 prophage-derived endonuclease YokF [Siminovitchia terrae]|uniref:thermonuclease family protein n=1 Tax=Siminovitchia terrae TaxID=1914933 RepID=UPI001B2D8537|nr:thermonuclease family protein [Siminovitchia terrae]GIN90172.1 SPBc2 prophage-derived endonuclease YokF [Siminovitchia terrae]
MNVIWGVIFIFFLIGIVITAASKRKITVSILALSLFALSGCSDVDSVPVNQDQKKDVQQQEVQEPTSAKDQSTDTSGTIDHIPVTLVKTIDGDTIKVLYNGKEQNVRYLLIDTPETNHPRLGKQPFGEEAKERNKQLVDSGDLTLEFDIGERVDKYGRLLAYVYVDGKSVQEMLLEEGLARVAYVYPPNTRHLTTYEEAQEKAKVKEIGIWSIENYTTDSGFKESSAGSSEGSQQSSTDSQPAKSQTSKPESGTEFFQNCTELRKVYPNGVPEGHPAYQAKMDRDKDGYACER